MRSRTLPPSRFQTGVFSAFPLMSQSAMSMPLSARADHTSHAVRHHGAEAFLPEPLNVYGILADEERRQILHGALHHARPAAAFADAGDARVRQDLEKEPVARAAPPAFAPGGIHPMRRRISLL